MVVTQKLDKSRHDKKVRLMVRQIPEASKRQLRDMTTTLMARVSATAKRDTNRYVRGFLMAGRDLGANVGPIPNVQPSKHAKRIRELIERQVERFGFALGKTKRELEYLYPLGRPKRPRSTAYAELFAKERELEKLYQRAKEELDKLNEGGEATLLIGFLHSGQAQKGRKLLSVRHRVYGGDGKFVVSRGATYAVVTNREPHAKILEKKWGAFKKSLSALRASVAGLDIRRQPFTRAMRAIHNG